MNATFRLNVDEVDIAFIERVKALFAHHPIEIAILEQDDTEYLMSNPKTAERLLESFEDFKAGKNMIDLDPSSFE